MELMEILMAALFATPGLAVSGRAIWNRRARRRNEHDLCARCGEPVFRTTDGLTAPYLVQGKLVCCSCSEHLLHQAGR